MGNRVLRYATVTDYIGQMRTFITPCTNLGPLYLSSCFQQIIKHEIPDDISFFTIVLALKARAALEIYIYQL